MVNICKYHQVPLSPVKIPLRFHKNLIVDAILAQAIWAQGALRLLPLTRAGHTSYGRSCLAGGEDQSTRCAAGRFPVDTPETDGMATLSEANALQQETAEEEVQTTDEMVDAEASQAFQPKRSQDEEPFSSWYPNFIEHTI